MMVSVPQSLGRNIQIWTKISLTSYGAPTGVLPDIQFELTQSKFHVQQGESYSSEALHEGCMPTLVTWFSITLSCDQELSRRKLFK